MPSGATLTFGGRQRLATCTHERLTELFVQDLGPAQHQEPDEDVKVAEDDERRRRSRAAVVLLDELISLEFPYSVGVLLNFLEREAARQTQKEERVGGWGVERAGLHEGAGLQRWDDTHLKMAMSRFSSIMLAKSK